MRMELDRALVADVRIVRRGLADDQRPGTTEERGLGQLLRADAAALLRCRQHNRDARRMRQPGGKAARGEQDGGNTRFHVRGAAAVEALAVGLAGERILRPLARAQRHGVEVPGQAKRRLRLAAAGPRDDAGAARRVLVILDAKSPLLEEAPGVARAVALAAGR